MLQELSNINAEDLVRADKLGEELCFEAGVPYFGRVLKLYSDLNKSSIDTIPYEILNSLLQHATEVKSKIAEIKSFSAASTSTPAATRDSLITYFRDSYNKHFQVISPIISFSIRKGTDFDALERHAKDQVIHIEAVVKEAKERLEQTAADAQSTLEKIRQTAAEAGVANHAIHFKNEYEEQLKQSKVWLLATVGVGLVTVMWGIFGFLLHKAVNGSPSTLELIQSFTSRFIVLSVLYYLLVWCARNYNAHRHNYIINKHRYNALNTFQAFAKAAEGDPDTKNAVLLQTTQSIFNQQASGYLSKEAEHDSSSKIIEILRSVGSTTK